MPRKPKTGKLLTRHHKYLIKEIEKGSLNPKDFLKKGLEELIEVIRKRNYPDFYTQDQCFQEVLLYIESNHRDLGVNSKSITDYKNQYAEAIKPMTIDGNGEDIIWTADDLPKETPGVYEDSKKYKWNSNDKKGVDKDYESCLPRFFTKDQRMMEPKHI